MGLKSARSRIRFKDIEALPSEEVQPSRRFVRKNGKDPASSAVGEPTLGDRPTELAQMSPAAAAGGSSRPAVRQSESWQSDPLIAARRSVSSPESAEAAETGWRLQGHGAHLSDGVGGAAANEETGMAMRSKTIGAEMRQAREAAGLGIEDVAAHLRIRSNFLAALEEGRADALPGVTYAIGYVRTYAAFLGLDAEEAVRRFKHDAAGLHSRTELTFPSPAPEGRVPGGGVMLVAALLATLAYGGWYVLEERGITLDSLVPAVPERLATLLDSEPSVPEAPASRAPAGDTASGGTVVTPMGGYADANPDSAAAPTRRAVVETQSPSRGEAPAPSGSEPSATDRAASAEPSFAETAPTTARPAPESDFVADRPLAAPLPSRPQQTEVGPPEVTPRAVASADPSATDPGETTGTAPAAAISETPIPETAEPEAGSSIPASPALSSGDGTAQAGRSIVTPSVAAVPDVPARQAGVPAERVVIRASGDSWVQIQDASGTALFTRVLKDGDIYRVPNRDGLTLATGNAGTLEVLVDGTPIPSLGEFGEVVRNIKLDPDQLKTR